MSIKRPTRNEWVVLALVFAAVSTPLVYVAVPGSVNGQSLGHSVAAEAGGASFFEGDTNSCSRADDQPERWNCEVLHEGGSGIATYDVTVGHGGCWEGRLPAGPRKAQVNADDEKSVQGFLWPVYIEDCVRVGDNVRLMSRIVP